MTSGVTYFIFLGIFSASLAQRCSEVVVVDSGDSGHWQGRVLINVPEAVNGWTVKLEFDNVVTSIDSALATVTGSLTSWTLTSRGFDDELEAGTIFELGFIVYFSGSEPTVIYVDFNEDLLCDEETHNPTTTTEGSEGGDCTDVAVVDTESSDYWQGRILVYVSESVNGWTVLLELDSPATAIESALATVSGSGTSWTLTSRGFDDELDAETMFELGIIVRFSGASPRAISVQFNENSLCDGGSPATTTTEGSQDACDDDDFEVETIYSNYWQGWIRINVPEDVSGWTVKVHFNSDVDNVETALASVSGEGSLWTLTSKDFDGDLTAGTLLEIGIIVHFSSSNAPFINNLIFNDDLVCSGGNAPTTSVPTDPPTETTPKTTKTTTKPTTTTTNGNFDECPNFDVTNEWQVGFNAELRWTVDHDTQNHWTVHLGFDGAVSQLDIWQGSVSTSDNKNFVVDNLNWDGDYSDGEDFTLAMLGYFSGSSRPKLISATFDNQDVCS